jgi:hypothetical protein
MTPVTAPRRFSLLSAPRDPRRRVGRVVVLALVAAGLGAVIYRGGPAIVLMPLVAVVLVGWLVGWGLMTARYVEVSQAGLTVGYPLRRSRVPLRKITGWHRADVPPQPAMPFSLRAHRAALAERHPRARVFASAVGPVAVVRLRRGRDLVIGVQRQDRLEQALAELPVPGQASGR